MEEVHGDQENNFETANDDANIVDQHVAKNSELCYFNIKGLIKQDKKIS